MTEQPSSLTQHWRIAEIRLGELSDKPFSTSNRALASDVQHVHLVRPSYQRSLVWTRQKAEVFRNSLSMGYPFGVIVLAHEGVTQTVNGMELPHHRYRIIDGQQRVYWLNKMHNGFFSDGWFLDESCPDERLLSLFGDLATNLSMDHSMDVIDLIDNIKRAVASENATTNPLDLLRSFIAVTGAPSPVEPDDLESATSAAARAWTYLDEMRRAFGALPVAALIVEKELFASLPDVFVKLNSGIRLSRFDIFAADWAIVTLNLDTAVQQNHIDQSLADELIRYSQNRLTDGDIEDSEYEIQLSEGSDGLITLYEYLYALSKYVCSRNPHTLGAIPNAEEELVVNVASILFAGDIGRMKDLVTNYPKDANGELDAMIFPQAVIRAAEAINDALMDLLNWDLGRTIDINRPATRRSIPNAFGLVQAASYMAAYVANIYDVKQSRVLTRPGGTGVTSSITNFKKSLRSWYLLDAVTSPFKGSDAYANASQRVWSSFQQRTTNNAMCSPVEWARLSDSVRNYVEDGLQVESTPQRRRLDQPGTGALLRLTYTGMHMVSNEDRDHVIPISVLQALPGAPANHLANWMPLNRTDNRSRGASLWPSCIDERRFDERRTEIKKLLLVEPEMCGPAAISSLQAFSDFLVMRYNEMVPKIVANLNHSQVTSTQEAVLSLSLNL